MVRVVWPPPPPPPPPLLPPPPQADTPKARAGTRQLPAATERTRKRVPPQGTRYRRPGILWWPPDGAQLQRIYRALILHEARRRDSGRGRRLRSAGCPAGTAPACAASPRRARSER